MTPCMAQLQENKENDYEHDAERNGVVCLLPIIPLIVFLNFPSNLIVYIYTQEGTTSFLCIKCFYLITTTQIKNRIVNNSVPRFVCLHIKASQILNLTRIEIAIEPLSIFPTKRSRLMYKNSNFYYYFSFQYFNTIF